MRILVVGAGATGGYFGGRLAQAGRDVTFLVRPKRAAQLQADGLQILSPHGDVTLTPKLVTADAIAAPYDAVLLTVKAFALANAAPYLHPRRVWFLTELPLAGTNKVDRRALMQRAAQVDTAEPTTT